MSTRLVLALVLVASAACGGDDGTNMQQVDAMMGSGAACTGAVYDPCTTNDQCMSQNCHFYMQSNFTVCVTTCTPNDNTTCPVDSSGQHGQCNMMGICKPAAANACTR